MKFSIFLMMLGIALPSRAQNSSACQDLFFPNTLELVSAMDSTIFNLSEVRMLTVLQPELTNALGFYRAPNGRDFLTPNLRQLNKNIRKMSLAYGFEPIFTARGSGKGTEAFNFALAADGTYYYHQPTESLRIHDLYHMLVFAVLNLHPHTRKVLEHMIQVNRAYERIFDDAAEHYGDVAEDILARTFSDSPVGSPLEATTMIGESLLGITDSETYAPYKTTLYDESNNPIVPTAKSISREQWVAQLTKQIKTIGFGNPMIADNGYAFVFESWSAYTNLDQVEKHLQSVIETTEEFLPHLVKPQTIARQKLLLVAAQRMQKENYFAHVVSQIQKIDRTNPLTEADYTAAAEELLTHILPQFISAP